MRDILLFLGAGFSAGLELPTMGEFGATSQEELSALKLPANIREFVPNLIQAGETFKKFQKICEKASRFSEIDTNHMEQLFCIAEIFKNSGIDELTDGDNIIRTDFLLKQIKLWLWKIYHRFPPLDVKVREIIKRDYNCINKFFEFLKEKELGNRLNIITTNYDLVVEYCTWEIMLKCSYPFNALDLIDLQIVDREDPQTFVDRIVDSSQPILLKLHGSINYFQIEETPDHSHFGITRDVANKGEIRIPSKSRPSIFMQDSYLYMCNKFSQGDINKITPEIIPPTYQKLDSEDWLKVTWNAAIQAFKNAKMIVFIGYSLPPTDGFLPSLIRASMTRKIEGSQMPQIVIIDPDPTNTIIRNYKSIFPYVEDGNSISDN